MSATAALGHDIAARLAAPLYGISPAAEFSLLSLSENATYAVMNPGHEADVVMRVHPANCHHSMKAIESELDWLDALSRDADVATPSPIVSGDGRRVVTVEVGGHERHAVLFDRIPGAQPEETDVNPRNFEILGELSARMHNHAREWRRPEGFLRIRWDWESSLGEQARWGRWQDGIAVGPEEEDILGKAAAVVHDRLGEFGQLPDRFGLIHADLRLANLLQEGDDLTVIDFDDCGFGWFMYDFATTVSFLEEDPRVPEWQQRWIDGYLRAGKLRADEIEMLATFIMFRRLLLLAWLGSHAHTDEANSRGAAWTADSCELAERYLRHGGSSVE